MQYILVLFHSFSTPGSSYSPFARQQQLVIPLISVISSMTWPLIELPEFFAKFSEGRASIRRLEALLEFPHVPGAQHCDTMENG